MRSHLRELQCCRVARGPSADRQPHPCRDPEPRSDENLDRQDHGEPVVIERWHRPADGHEPQKQ